MNDSRIFCELRTYPITLISCLALVGEHILTFTHFVMPGGHVNGALTLPHSPLGERPPLPLERLGNPPTLVATRLVQELSQSYASARLRRHYKVQWYKNARALLRLVVPVLHRIHTQQALMGRH